MTSVMTSRPMQRFRTVMQRKAVSCDYMGFVEIGVLPHKLLRQPLSALLENDGDGFIARSIDLPLFGYGDDPIEAVNHLKAEIESLYDDLMEDDQFSAEWLNYKRFLQERVMA